jgi:hypothetical protein
VDILNRGKRVDILNRGKRVRLIKIRVSKELCRLGLKEKERDE